MEPTINRQAEEQRRYEQLQWTGWNATAIERLTLFRSANVQTSLDLPSLDPRRLEAGSLVGPRGNAHRVAVRLASSSEGLVVAPLPGDFQADAQWPAHAEASGLVDGELERAHQYLKSATGLPELTGVAVQAEALIGGVAPAGSRAGAPGWW